MANSYDLAGKTAVVTGGGSGIGRAIAQLLLASGATVWVWDTASADLQGVAWVRVDVTDPAEIGRAINRLIQQAQRIDILVNSAGYLGRLHAFDEHEADDWLRIIQINLIGTLQVTHQVLPHMRRWGGGHIVNMRSLAGKEGLAALGREVASSNIYVNCVAPGPIDTGMIRGLGPEVVMAMVQDSPMKRLGTAEEVAHLVAWPCSDASRFNTGAVFDMSRGRARY